MNYGTRILTTAISDIAHLCMICCKLRRLE